VQVRLAVVKDLEAIVAIDPIARDSSERRRQLGEAITAEQCLVADGGDRVLGYAVFDYSFYGNGFLALLVVRPESRRQGLGKALARSVESRCRAAKLFTSTNLSNLSMQLLLAQLRYQPSGVIHNLDPGDPELVFFKEIAKSKA
jgi:GNAT superfamily N-acetyltransferase